MRRALFVCTVLLASCCSLLNARPKTQKNHEGLKVVTAGDSVTFHVGLDQIPQTAGHLAVLICPIRPSLPEEAVDVRLSRSSSIDTTANNKSYDLSVVVPGDAPKGTWEAFFSFAPPNGSFSELRHTRTEFFVNPRQNNQKPQYASIGVNQ